jgi:ELWxxDGT repeat protein
MANDIYPGAPGSTPVNITEFNGALYFRAQGNASGQELWKYENGVPSMVADINPGSGGSMPNQFTVLGSDLYFTAFTVATGLELFKYDGVSVTNVADIAAGSGGSSISFLTAIGTELYFTADDGTTGMEPWKFDGSVATQIDDINPGSGGSNANAFAGAGGYVYFTAFHMSTGFELYKYDGSVVTMDDLYPGAFSSDIGEITPIGSKVCFRATNGTQGYELWVHDGTTVTCLDVCTVGPGDFTPWEFTPFGSDIYFRGFIQDTGYELWKFDGTTASLVTDIYVGSENAHPNNMTAGTSFLYFAADDGTTGNELWKTDGVTTTLIGDINPGASESMSALAWSEKLVTIGDNAFVLADDGTTGYEIWRYDGTSTYLGRDIIPGTGSPTLSGMIGYGDSLFFMADDLTNGPELWVWKLDEDLSDSISVVTCGNYTSPGGTVYNTQGVYDFVDIVPSINCPGCDSLVTVHLVISNPIVDTTIYACDGYISPAGDSYTIPGTYSFTDTIPSLMCTGVDSIINIDLILEANLNTTVIVFSGVILVSQVGGQYQWLDCDNGYAPIAGANDQDFLPTVDGNYACEITIGNCIDTTNCEFVESTFGVGIADQDDSDIKVYPNPVSNQLFISSSVSAFMSVRVFNILGKEVYYTQDQNTDTLQVDLSTFAKGIYRLEIATPSGNISRKIVKN